MVDLQNKDLRKNFIKGNFVLERENFRVNRHGYLSLKEHPFGEHPFIKKNFHESQIKIITPICKSIEQLYEKIDDIHTYVELSLMDMGEEYLWPFSYSPYIKDFSGVNFNFSFDDLFIKKAYMLSEYQSKKDFKNKIYMNLIKNVFYYSWILVYLTAAYPVYDENPNLEILKEKEMNHIELRMIDLNPLTRLGIYKEDLYFIHYFLLYLFSLKLDYSDENKQIEAIENHKRAALLETSDIYILNREKEIPVVNALKEILDSMEFYFKELEIPSALPYIHFQRKKINAAGKRYAEIVFQKFCHNSVKKGILLSKSYIKKEELYVRNVL